MQNPSALNDLNKFDDLSWTPLIQAVKSEAFGTMKAVDMSNVEIVRLLLQNRANPLTQGWMGWNAADKAQRRAEKVGDTASIQIASLLKKWISTPRAEA